MKNINSAFLLMMFFFVFSCREKKEEIVKHYDSKTIVLNLKQASGIYYKEILQQSSFSKNHEIDDKEIDLEVPYIYLNKLKERVVVTSILDPDRGRIRYTVSFIFHRDSYEIRKAYFTRFSPHENYYEHNKGASIYNDFTGIAEMYLPEGNQRVSMSNILEGERVRLVTSNTQARTSDIELPEIIIIGDRGVWCPVCGTEITSPSVTRCPICDYCFSGSCGGGGGGGGGGGIDPGTGGGGGGTLAIRLNTGGGKIDPKKETNCFNQAEGATLTVFVEQPRPGTRDVNGPNQVGHTFIGIQQNGTSRFIGYYPDSPMASLIGSQDGELHSNENSNFNVSISISIGANQLASVITYINNYPQTYNLNKFNCTDFAIEVANRGGLNLPETIGTYNYGIGTFSGHNPGDLGEDIRNMTLPTNATRNTTGGKSPMKSGSCE